MLGLAAAGMLLAERISLALGHLRVAPLSRCFWALSFVSASRDLFLEGVWSVSKRFVCGFLGDTVSWAIGQDG